MVQTARKFGIVPIIIIRLTISQTLKEVKKTNTGEGGDQQTLLYRCGVDFNGKTTIAYSQVNQCNNGYSFYIIPTKQIFFNMI